MSFKEKYREFKFVVIRVNDDTKNADGKAIRFLILVHFPFSKILK